MSYIGLCKLDDIPALGARRFEREDGKVIAIFRNADNKVFALQDKCPHKGGPLSQGIVFGESVACPLHNWCISLNDGCAEKLRPVSKSCVTSFSNGDSTSTNILGKAAACCSRSLTRSSRNTDSICLTRNTSP